MDVVEMKRLIITNLMILITLSVALSYAAEIKLAFLTERDKFDDTDKFEYQWADENFKTSLLRVKNGKFVDESGNSRNLKDFAVIWWHKADEAKMPEAFLDNSVKNAILDYVKSGGSAFFSQVAFHYPFDLGLESQEPRLCGPNVDGGPNGFMPAEGQIDHPIFKGFKKADLEKGILHNTYGHDCMSDFYPNSGKDREVIGNEWQEPKPAWFGQVNPLSQYHHGDGLIFISGWRETVLRNQGEYYDRMTLLHENIINYLVSESVFAQVDAGMKVAATWGKVKRD
jgi:hypothetical protein